MYGLFQTVFYFANMFVFSFGFGIMCGKQYPTKSYPEYEQGFSGCFYLL